MLELVLLSLAVWRVTALLVYDDGPWNVFARLRDAIGGPLNCFWCTSVWVSLVASLVLWPRPGYPNGIILWWAIGGLSILLDELRLGKPEEM